MPDFALVSIASALKIASLNLCTDEYLLLLARPDEVASVTRLSQDPAEILAVAPGTQLSGQSRVCRKRNWHATYPVADDGRQRTVDGASGAADGSARD